MKRYIQIFTIILISLLSSCVSTQKTVDRQKLPTCYQTGSHISYPESKYISAYAFDNNEKKAMLLARNELSSKISSTVSGKNLLLKKAYRENTTLMKSSVKFEQVVKVETNFAHNELIKIINTYYDHDSKRYYAFAVLNRDKYADVLESEMALANKVFEKKYKLALEMLKNLNIKDFKKIKNELVKDSFKYDSILVNYSTVLNNNEIYEKHSLTKNMTELNNLYKKKLHQTWYIYTVYNNINEKDFKGLTQYDHLMDNDGKRSIFSENKELTRAIFETIRDDKFKAQELSEYNYNPKKMITRNNLSEIIKILENSNDKIVITATLLYNCSHNSGFYFCRTGADVKAYNLENKEQLFYFSVAGRKVKKVNNKIIEDTKAVETELYEAMKKSISKLSPIIKKRLLKYMKDYKDIE